MTTGTEAVRRAGCRPRSGPRTVWFRNRNKTAGTADSGPNLSSEDPASLACFGCAPHPLMPGAGKLLDRHVAQVAVAFRHKLGHNFAAVGKDFNRILGLCLPL